MKYDGFQRVAQRFEVLWPESIRYATSALQERLSTSCFYCNNRPYCPLRWSSVFGLSFELKEDHQNNRNHRKCAVVRCVYPAPAPGRVLGFFVFRLFLCFFMIWDELVLAEFITFTVVFLARFGDLCQQQWAVLLACYCLGHKTVPHFLYSVKTNDHNFVIFTVLCSEE